MSRTVADLLVGVLERLEPAFHRTRPQRPRPNWLSDTFEVLGSEVLQPPSASMGTAIRARQETTASRDWFDEAIV